jgi:geranyl-CoA carboxylase beta subunit
MVAARSYEEPLFDSEELLGIVPTDHRKPYDAREIVARIVDRSEFLEFKPRYGSWTLCGHAAVRGHAVGIIGNNGPIDADGATKAAQFIQLCCQSGTPLLFLQNTTGFMVGVQAERSGIIKHGSKMIQAVTNASVPKITIQLGGSFGAGHYAMCGRAFAPRFIFAWPNNRVSVMGGEQAAKVLTIIAEEGARARGKEPNYAELEATSARLLEAYQRESAATYASARLWDDGIIDPRDTRRVVGECLAICEEARLHDLHPNSFGVARL